MKKFGLVTLGLLLVAAVMLCLPDSSAAQKAKGKTRPAMTKQLMKGIVNVNCGDLKKALEAEQADWDAITLKAALLNEAGYLLMEDGRCPDAEWAKAAKALQQHSAAVLVKAEAKDLPGAQAAFKELTGGSCAVCHKAHRPKA
ncbi:MAG: hypothetical protein HY000_20595 [Planctomycetes bacterium]|nr:hypothetical protein [Planctomycetota bacterium]